MEASPKRVPIQGSDKQLPSGAKYLGPVKPDERIELTFILRPKAELPAARTRGRHLTRDELAAQHGAAPADVDRVMALAKGNGLDVVGRDDASRRVVVAGPAAKIFAAIGADVGAYEHGGQRFRGRKGAIHLPEDVAEVVEGVFGLDDRGVAKPHFRRIAAAAHAADKALRSFTPVELGTLYSFPQGTTGKGQCVAIIELGGGYRPADLAAYFKGLKLTTPTIVSVGVDGGSNAPTGSADGPDGEVMLDVEVVGALAPEAKIAVYFAPNTDRGFLDAILAAVHDKTNAPSIISISWGGPESSWTSQSLKAFDKAFQAAALVGITVCAAAGDDGSTDGVSDGRYHVDFPASSPHVLGCGGTRLSIQDSAPAETVWNDLPTSGATGGGVSEAFPLPAWQTPAHVEKSANPGGKIGRGVPDIAGDADPFTGYKVRVDGTDTVIGGTSAVAPLWAALVARCNERLGHAAGFINPALYTASKAAFHDVVAGTNGEAGAPSYSAGQGWDACTGLGTPIGDRLLECLAQPSV